MFATAVKPSLQYTIHHRVNDVFTIRKKSTSVVAFRRREDAVFIGCMLETHFEKQQDWPDSIDTLYLPTSRYNDLTFLYLQEWTESDLKIMCTRNFMDMVAVENVVLKNNSFTLQGGLYSFEAPDDFYRDRLEELV